jgi:aspartate aminotransferase-like enzyme
MPAKEFLMIPGPTPVPDAVLEAAARHPIGHRTADFSRILRHCVDELKWLGDTDNDVYVLTSSGTGGMESAIANIVSEGDNVLSLICGVFGERWAKIAESYGAKVERMKVEPGQAISVEAVRKRLEADSEGKIRAVTITHNETSTGVINDLESLVAAVHSHGAISIVDAVTSFGACPLPISAWNVDVLVTGSQKALMLPPGLGFVFVSERARKAAAECKSPRFYFDWARYKKSLDADTTPFTPNVSFVVALEASLQLMREEGKEVIYARHEGMKEKLRKGIKDLGLRLFVDEGDASPTITSIIPPDGISVDSIRKGLRNDYKILVADGQEELKGKIFRIGHMGYVFERDILMTLSSLQAVLEKLGYRVPSYAK